MWDTINFQALRDESLLWFQDHILTLDSALQGAALFAAGFLAILLSRPLRARLTRKINSLQKLPFRVTEMLHSVARLVFPFIMLVVLFIGTKIIGPGGLGLETAFLIIVVKLLWAWVMIRLCVQFIGNRFARNVFAITIWTIAALSIFGVLDQTSDSLSAVGFSLGAFRITALGVIKGMLALAAMLYGAMALAGFVDRRLEKVGLNSASRLLIGKIVRIFLIACALMIAITTAGIDLSVLAVFSGAVGLGIGFGLQRGMSNLFSGMMLLVDQSIKPGDIIEVPNPGGEGTTFGWVQQMGGRHTAIITRDNKTFLIPNEHLITQQVVNWSHGDTLVRLETGFGVHYESDPHAVRKIAVEAAKKPQRVEETPAPVCHMVEFGESSLKFVLRFWIRDAENGITNVRGEVMLAIWDAFKEHGIRIPYPHREMFIHQVT